uniref:Galectin n=1 Tax=Pavo cristatus TaxID=9049 RepID=A0A8C9FPV2_PAVCR
IVIHGSVPDDADRFQVDLQCGSSIKPRADVAFHFNPRFKWSGCVVCNTLEREKWGWEEITYEMPFQKGRPFEIVIMILKDKFQVSLGWFLFQLTVLLVEMCGAFSCSVRLLAEQLGW